MHENRNNLRGSQEHAHQKTGTAFIKKYDHSSAAFCSKCSAWRGELGLEPTMDLYVKHLCDIFDEVGRVLKNEGTCWVNLGDTYAGSGKGVGTRLENAKETYILDERPRVVDTVPAKSLCMIPARFAIEMCSRGWILRNELIWWKPNCMPSSATDRFTVDFEKMFFFVKSRRYYFERQYEQYTKPLNRWGGPATKPTDRTKGDLFAIQERGGRERRPNPLGRHKRCVWRIPTKPFRGAHFAVFPPELVETPLKAGSPKDGIVLDPFMGSGTTALVALQHKRRFIGIELNAKYVALAKRRILPVLESDLSTRLHVRLGKGIRHVQSIASRRRGRRPLELVT